MAVSNLVIGTIMGVVLLLIAAGVNVIRTWRRESPEAEAASGAVFDALRSPAVWTVAFVLLAFAFGLGAVVVVGGLAVPALDSAVAAAVMIAAFGVLIVAFFFAGVYSTARARGADSAPAVALVSGIVGLLVIVAIVAKLLLG